MKVIDLTHTISENMPVYPVTECPKLNTANIEMQMENLLSRHIILETKRLYILNAVEKDIETIMTIECDKENKDFVWSSTYDEHKTEINDPSFLPFMFKLKDDNSVIGYALVKLYFKSDVFELRNIVITKKGYGYGKEVMKALFKYAFEEKNTNRFWLDVYPDNIKGIKLYEGLGMHCDGVLRQNYKSERGYLDQIIYSMLKDEYF